MEEIIKNVKTSNMFNETEHLIKEMIDNIGIIRLNRGTNSSAVKDQKRIIENEIQELRTQINNHLDKLQENLMKKLTEAETRVTKETCELLVSLDEKPKELTEYQTNIVNIKKYASDLQTCLAVKQIEKDVEIQDKRMQAIVNSDRLNQTKLSYKIDSGLRNITTNIQMFGEVVVESKPCEMNLVRKKDKQAQMTVTDLSPPISVENIQLKLKQKINIKGMDIAGCSLLSDGRMVFSCCHTKTVSFINKEGVELFQIGKDKIGFTNAYNTIFIKDNNSVAESSGLGGTSIAIMDIESQKVMTIISMETYIYGMAITGRTIYCCAGSEGIKILNLNNNSISNINSNMSGVYYVATSGDKLYYPSIDTHTVTCCDLHGTTQWEFNNKRVLPDPVGISVDNDGYVYVVNGSFCNVVVISPDGQRHRQLLSSKDGLINPRAKLQSLIPTELVETLQLSLICLYHARKVNGLVMYICDRFIESASY
jgi:hypothetical protein